MNKTIVIGRITADLTPVVSKSGKPVLSFTVAVDRRMSANGQKETDFFDCVAFSETANFIAKYFGKGEKIGVEGHLQSRVWEDKNGTKHKSVEIIVENAEFIESKRNQTQTTASTATNVQQQPQAQTATASYNADVRTQSTAGNTPAQVAVMQEAFNEDLPF